MLTEDDLNEIANSITFATEGIWSDMEVQYKTALEVVQVCIHELKVQLSLIQASVTQASQTQTSMHVTSAQLIDIDLPTTIDVRLIQIPAPTIHVDPRRRCW